MAGDQGGWARRRYRERSVRDLIRSVALIAADDLGSLLTEEVFNRFRAAAGHPHAPVAESICRRLMMPWRELVELALDDCRDWHRFLGARRMHRQRGGRDSYDAVVTLQRVARELPGVPLRPRKHDAIRRKLVRRSKASGSRGGGLDQMLLTSTQIIRICGTWNDALELAGLPPRSGRPPLPRGISVVEAMHRYVELTGRCPSALDLVEWGRVESLGIAVRDQPMAVYRAQLRMYRDSLGLSTPADPSGAPRQPPLPTDTVPEVPRTRFSWQSADRCTTALTRYLFELPPGGGPITQASYQVAVAGKRRFPSWSTLGRWAKRDGTTIDAMFLEAERRLAEHHATDMAPPEDAGSMDERSRKTRKKSERRVGLPSGVARIDAIAMFVAEQDAFPGDGLLRWWARTDRGMSLAAPDRPHSEAIAAVAHAIRLGGGQPPERLFTMRDRDQLRPGAHQEPPVGKVNRGWTIADCKAAIPLIIAKLDADEHFGVGAWQRISEGRRDLPSQQTVARLARTKLGLTFTQFIQQRRRGL